MSLQDVLHTKRQGNLESYVFSLVMGIVIGAIIGTMAEMIVDYATGITTTNDNSLLAIIILLAVSISGLYLIKTRSSRVEANEFILQIVIQKDSFQSLVPTFETLQTSIPQIQPILQEYQETFTEDDTVNRITITTLGSIREKLQQANRPQVNLLLLDAIETMKRYENAILKTVDTLVKEMNTTGILEREGFKRKKKWLRRSNQKSFDIDANWGFRGTDKWLMRISFEYTDNILVPCLCYIRIHAGTPVTLRIKAINTVRTVLRSGFSEDRTLIELRAWDFLYEESPKSYLEPIRKQIVDLSSRTETMQGILEDIRSRS